jgi:bifunctional enzyme CysN/CysC
LNADIKRDDAVEWKEHIRRISELAYIFMDSGTILVMTAVELTQEDLHVIDSIVGPKKVKVAWVGDDVTTDIEFDLHVNVNMNFENSVVKIKELLMDQGAIFKL